MTEKTEHILLLVTQADWGGVQGFLVKFAARLRQEGTEVLLAAGGEGELWKRAADLGIKTHKLSALVRDMNPYRDWRAYREIKDLIDDFRPDAVHLNSSKMGVLGSLAASRSKTKPRVVYRIGGWAFLEPIAGWKKWIYRTAEKLTAPLKDVIITVHPGDEVAADRLGIKPRGRITTVANGLDLDDFTGRLLPRGQARELLGLPDDAFVFGTVANAYATKGLLPYLDVLKTILDADPKSYAIILGDGPEFKDLKSKCDRLGLKRLILTGQRSDANRLYRAFDTFVLPSVKEGMPWTVLEAMAAEVPIVATDVGACRWMTDADADRPAGIIVPPQEPEKLRHAMETMATDDGRRHFGEAGRRIIQDRFTWGKTYHGNREALSG
ncbi:MAG: glycosyltransferase family 4 protein [Patescibacteria group bacterium]